MHRLDHEWAGFSWLDFADYGASVISFARMAEGFPCVAWVFNFTPVARHGYCIPMPHGGGWREVLNTDSRFYSGSDVGNPGIVQSRERGGGHHIEIILPPLAGLAFMPV